ncbi:Pre-mRNA splicing factor [Rhizoctonia solani AG-3 Rhs1AP]|uniref:Pre-mRNA splicing factor n=1 Tax=Rhizoctonia solani AG-3 Rhs1AP TaxID=1086054 RepID=X8JEG6_9AGAM|nr:Pre-mRNA splicing factor [Rhizoctonia solani AG-3 Rhs1AP]
MSVAVANPMNAMMDSQVNAMIEDAVASANQQNLLSGGDSNLPKTGAAKYATGMIYPPPDIRAIIDRTASFVARSSNPVQFEDKIRESQRNEPKFSFLNSADPYHAYYRHRIQKVEDGEEEPEAAPVKQDVPQETVAPIQAPPKEPPAHEFVFDAPQVSAVDLDIIKLTALYTARRGRPFLNALMTREARNFQFDFLRPNHSLFSYFNNLVDQFTRVLRPPRQLLAKIALHATPEGKWDMLAEARERATYERWRRERERKKEDDQEAERIAFAEIDWHDYHVVQTIEFTAADATSDLPPPMSIAEVENMTLAQKRMAAQIMEATAPDVEAYRAANVQLEEELDPEAYGSNGLASMGANADDEEMRERKRREAEEREREEVRAREMQNGTNAPMKIRKDYVPKTLAAKAASEASHDNVYYLRSASSRVRACRTQAYRASGSQVEVPTRQSRNASRTSQRTPRRCECCYLASRSGAHTYRYLWCRGRRRGAQEGGFRGADTPTRTRKGCLGRSHSIQGRDTRQVPVQRKFGGTDRSHPQGQARYWRCWWTCHRAHGRPFWGQLSTHQSIIARKSNDAPTSPNGPGGRLFGGSDRLCSAPATASPAPIFASNAHVCNVTTWYSSKSLGCNGNAWGSFTRCRRSPQCRRNEWGRGYATSCTETASSGETARGTILYRARLAKLAQQRTGID